MSDTVSTSITRHDGAHASDRRQDTCAGCLELTARVERLEQQLQLQGPVAAPFLNTTNCYWICIGVHVFFSMALFSSPVLMQVGFVALAGACGTAAVCHVLSTRTIVEKILRTLLSFTSVLLSLMLVMGLQDSFDVSDLAPTLLLYLPPLFLSGWFVSKLFVWIRGWRIVPPGYPEAFPKLQIRHLMACTLMFALYLAGLKLFTDDLSEFYSGEMLAAALYVVIPVAFGTVLSCWIARILLSHRRGPMLRPFIALGAFALLATMLIYLVVLALSGSLDSIDLDGVFLLVLYFMAAVAGLVASPVFTFALMRQTGYRLIHPDRAQSQPDATTEVASTPAAGPAH